VRYVLPVLYAPSNFAAAGGIVLYAPTSDESPNPVLPGAEELQASPPVLCVMHDLSSMGIGMRGREGGILSVITVKTFAFVFSSFPCLC